MFRPESSGGQSPRDVGTTGTHLSYVLVTPARDEEAYIEKTIKSVVSQTVLPTRWVVVSDASTDRTDEIVSSYCLEHPWIQLVRIPERRRRSFAAKIECFNAGLAQLEGLEFDVIGNLDADISFDPQYFEFLLGRFKEIEDLGVAGTGFRQMGYDSTADSFEGAAHVPGGCQLFRRGCFEDIGGYQPIPGGGVDWVAVTTARMKGWKTMSFKEKFFFHYRPLGTGQASWLGAAFQYGKKDYLMGGHPVWEASRVAYRMTKKPYAIGGLALLAGYVWAFCSNVERPIPPELVKFHRREQMKKLRRILRQILRFRRPEKFSRTT